MGLPFKKTIWIIFLLSLILSLFCNRPDRNLKIGEEYLIQGRLDKALAKFTDVLEKEPENVQALYMIGWIYHLLGDNDRARGIFERCIEIDSSFYGGYKGLGSVFLSSGNYPIAEKNLKKALELSSDKSPVFNSIGHLYMVSGKMEEAEKSYLKAVELSPGAGDYLYSLAYYYFINHNYENALSSIDRALKGEFREKKFKPLSMLLRGKILLVLGTQVKEKYEYSHKEEDRKKAIDLFLEAEKNLNNALKYGFLLRDNLKEINRIKRLLKKHVKDLEEG